MDRIREEQAAAQAALTAAEAELARIAALEAEKNAASADAARFAAERAQARRQERPPP